MTSQGLTYTEAKKRLTQYGPNNLPEGKPTRLVTIFLRQFLSPLIYILLAAACVSLMMHEQTDAIFIFAVLLINAGIGTVQEYSAQRAATSLRDMVPSMARVIRDGERQLIHSSNVVPGDSVLLEAGDKVPADIALESCHNLSIDESLLTGESIAITKSINDAPGQSLSKAFAGSMVIRGRGCGIVMGTGLQTEIGKIAKDVIKEKTTKPPLMKRIEKFTLGITFGIILMILLISLILWIKGGSISQIFMLAVALSVSAIPEGLPAAITIALAIGMNRMAKRNVIVRKLLAVESLGSCTFIASDKTGTLTINELTVREVIQPDGTHTSLEDNLSTPLKKELYSLALAGELANEAEGDHTNLKGDMVDVAFRKFAHLIGIDRQSHINENPSIETIPYESEIGYAASIHENSDIKTVYVKGSFEKVFNMCSHMQTPAGNVPIDNEKLEDQVSLLASKGLRVIALAKGEYKKRLSGLTFLGIVGMIDPLRPEAKDAILDAQKAGIEISIITGDHPMTALTIAQDLGLNVDEDNVITGNRIKQALEQGSNALDKLIQQKRIFARIEPTQKKDIVDALMRRGHFVAVTGDGVNDAPALKHAHVGVAMGKRGTDVARESADIIITDDNFSSLINGIHEGRVIYGNIRKVIYLLIATGAAEVFMFLLALITGLPLPLLPVQLLWLNLVTNGIQDIALAFEPSEGHELNQSPREPSEPIFNRLMISRVLTLSIYIGTVACATFAFCLNQGMNLDSARNTTLLLMVLFENMHALNSRSETRSIFRMQFFSNKLLVWGIFIAQSIHILAMYTPGISSILSIQPVTLLQWAALLLIASTLLGIEKIYHAGRRLFG